MPSNDFIQYNEMLLYPDFPIFLKLLIIPTEKPVGSWLGCASTKHYLSLPIMLLLSLLLSYHLLHSGQCFYISES